MSDPYINDRQHPNNFQTGHSNWSKLKPTFLKISVNNINSSIDVPVGNMKLYVFNNASNLIPLWGCTESCTFYNNMDLYNVILSGDVEVYDEHEVYIDPSYYDELFWQHILEAYATNGESAKPDFTDQVNNNSQADKYKNAYGEMIVTRPSLNIISNMYSDIKVTRGLDYGQIPARITFVTNRSFDSLGWSFQPHTSSSLVFTVKIRSVPSPSNYNDDQAFFKEVLIKREDGSDLQSGDLSSTDGVEEAILHTDSSGNLEYRVVGLGASSSGGGGGGSTTPTVFGWQETVSNRAHVAGIYGKTYIYSEGNTNNLVGATADISGLSGGHLCPLHTGKGQKLKRMYLTAVAGAVNGGTVGAAVYARFRLYRLYLNGWVSMSGPIDLEVVDIAQVGLNNNQTSPTGSGLLRAEWEDSDGITLLDNVPYGIMFENGNLNTRLNSLTKFTLRIEGERDI